MNACSLRLGILGIGWLTLAVVVNLGCDLQHAVAPGGNTSQGDANVERGTRLFKERKFAEAIVPLEAALQQPCSTPSSLILTVIGNCYNELDEFEKAVSYHDRAIAADPRNYKAYVNRGISYRLQGDFAKAKESYNRALEIEPDYAELYASLGALAIHQGEFEEGVQHLERAIRLDPQVAVAHANLAVGYASVGRFTDADRELKTAIVQGYRNGPLIQERIDELKKTAEQK